MGPQVCLQWAACLTCLVYIVHPKNRECFLRMLFHEVRGPTSFNDLKSFDKQVCTTYQEACFKRGLLESDQHWDDALTEAFLSRLPSRLRHLFAMMLQMCEVSYPLGLYEKESLSEDVLYNYKRCHPKINDYYEALVYLEDQVLKLGGTDLAHFGLPQPDKSAVTRVPLPLARETTYDVFEQADYAAENEPSLNEEQRSVLEEVMSSVNEGKGSFYFLDSPGGTGKTFLLKLILAKVRVNQDVAIAVASSGITSILLPNGRTAHSTLKLPIDLTSKTERESTCNIRDGSAEAKLL